MIFHDRVSVICKTKEGNAVVETFNGVVPAIVVPLPGAQVVIEGGSINQTRYQIVLAPFSYEIPINAAASVPSGAGDNQILFAWGPYPKLLIEGRVERHMVRGRLHHYEALVKY